MESRKRKRTADGVDGHPTRSRPGGEDYGAVTDDEVEEFFGILRRWNHLSCCFAGGGGGGGVGRLRAPTDGQRGAVRWSPAFSWEDFAGTDAGEDDDRKGRSAAPAVAAEERVAENATSRLLDLNAEPEPEPEPDGLVVASPRGKSAIIHCRSHAPDGSAAPRVKF